MTSTEAPRLSGTITPTESTESADDGAEHRSSDRRGVLPVRGVDSWRWDAVVIALIMVVVVAFNWLHVAAYKPLSPIDEFQHVDYLYKAGKGEMVGRGDLVGDEAMHEEACRGIDAVGPVLPCLPIGSYNASQFQEGGQNTAYIHSPVYYFGTAWVGKVVVKVTPIDNLMKAARLLGPMWVLPALLLMVPTMRLLGARVASRFAVSLLAVTVPMVLHATATVNPDATALLGGALILCPPILLGARWSGRAGRLLDGLAAAASMALKPSNLVVLIAGLWLRVDLTLGPARADEVIADEGPVTDVGDEVHVNEVVEVDLTSSAGPATVASSSPSVPKARRFRTVAAALVPLLIGAGIVSVVMLLVQSGLAHEDPKKIVMLNRFMIKGFPWTQFGESFLSTGSFTAGGSGTSYLAPFLRLPFIIVMSGLIALASLVTTGVAAIRRDRVAAMARSTLVATVLGAPALIIVNFVLQQIYVSIPARYFMSLIPGVAIVCAVVLGRTKLAERALWLVTAVWLGSLTFAFVAAV
ncbi:MAG TPA: hypothetical protein PLS63_08405 [Microthrixaceae bacterium]|nr:hypothetical protein [Microthrixaceae bacterium]